MALFAVCHPKLCEFTNALLVLSPEHYGIFRNAGWDRKQIESELHKALVRPGKDLVQGAQGIGEGIDPRRADEMVNKFWPEGLEGLLIVRAGGKAGLFSAICGGWTGGRFRDQSQPVAQKARAAGCDDYAPKPYGPQLLAALHLVRKWPSASVTAMQRYVCS